MPAVPHLHQSRAFDPAYKLANGTVKRSTRLTSHVPPHAFITRPSDAERLKGRSQTSTEFTVHP